MALIALGRSEKEEERRSKSVTYLARKCTPPPYTYDLYAETQRMGQKRHKAGYHCRRTVAFPGTRVLPAPIMRLSTTELSQRRGTLQRPKKPNFYLPFWGILGRD